MRRPDPQRGIRLASADAEGIDGRIQSRGHQRPEYELDHDRADAILVLVVVDPIRHRVLRVGRVPVARDHDQRCQDPYEPGGLCPLVSAVSARAAVI